MDLIASRQPGDLERAAELQAQIWATGFKRAAGQENASVYELVRQMSLAALNNQKDVIKETGFLMEDPLNPPAMERLQQVTFPVLAIAGDLDDDVVLQTTDLLAGRIPRAQKAIIHGTAHMPNMERPEEFNRIVLSFLNEVQTML
jgi:pimeloyl-ACP methyl ester carboxylesterase